MTDESRKLDAIYNAVMKLTDVQLSRKELATRWGVDEETITNYTKHHELPRLKNKKYPLSACNDWLYESTISRTEEGKRILKAIENPKKK
jgi:hypothetical protein